MSEKNEGRIVPAPVDADTMKGTAAAHPVLVVDGSGRDNRSPAEIEAELDRTRAHLSDTLDELADRLSPRTLARRWGQGARAQVVDTRTGRVRRDRAIVMVSAGALVAAVVALLATRHTR